MYTYFIKPIADIGVAFLVLLLLSPVFLIGTIGLYIVNHGKPFFTQLRPGKNGNIFKIIKFKTMNDKKDEQGSLLSDAQRITPIGSFIRKTSLDELPQLLNVIKGDMSMVGPRPLLPEYLELYTKEQARRHEVKPGITGWAQVNGRNAITWEEKFKKDVWYVDHQNFILDMSILFKTIKKVMVRDGINKKGEVTTTPFKG